MTKTCNTAEPTGPRYEVFTDGSCIGNPGPGGFGWVCRHVVVDNGEEIEVARRLGSGSEADTTNSRMEMLAALDALRAIGTTSVPVHLFSDSEFLVRGMNEWLAGWKARGWRKSNGTRVANIRLWEEIETAAAHQRNLTWNWVMGHAGNPFNEQADRLAQGAAQAARIGTAIG